MEEINVMLDEGAIMPTRAHAEDAGLDLYTPKNAILYGVFERKHSAVIDTGVHVQIPTGYVGMIKSKSGMNVYGGIVCEGVIDAGYTGSICVKLYNHGRLTMEKSAAQDMKSLLVANGMTSRAAGRVVEILEPMGYFEVPASMTYHGAWPGGLFEHSWAVTKQLVCLTDKLGLKWQMRRSPVLVGMLHDLCKTEEYEKCGDGWKHHRLKGHGERSAALAEAILNDTGALSLTEEEQLCIRWHMGAFDDKENWNCYGAAIEEYQNVLWTHTADMVASRVLGV